MDKESEKLNQKTPSNVDEYIDELKKVYPADENVPINIKTSWDSLDNLKADKDPEMLKEIIKKTVQDSKSDLSKDEKKELAKVLLKIFQTGELPKDAMGITPQKMAEIYSFAFSLFSAGKYDDSKELFKYLLSIEPNNSDFATSLATCYHRLKDYEGALVFYLTSIGLNQNDPLPSFYAYDCFLNLNCKPFALVMLENTILRAQNQPKYAKILEKATDLAEELENEVITNSNFMKP